VRSSKRFKSLAPFAAAALLLNACATPFGVERADPRRVQRELVESAVTGDRPSAPTREFLTRESLADRFRSAPDATLAELHAGLAPTGDMDRLYALAELSLLRAEATRDGGRAFAAALYAYAFLFDERNPPLGRFDPRMTVARWIYNRSLGLALGAGPHAEFELTSGRRAVPFGELDVAFDPDELLWSGFRLERFVATAEFRVRGLDNRYREPGIGAALAAALGESVDAPEPARAHLPARLRVPTTAFLRVEAPRQQLASGRVAGRLELYSDAEPAVIEIGGEAVPLEIERSTSLALMLEGMSTWDFGALGLRLNDFLPDGEQRERLVFLRPFAPDRIPLVLVHGTFSNPASWAQLVNELENDPEVTRMYQVWLFMYNSGNPIGYSAGILAETLRRLVAQLDPGGTHTALWRMVVAGHSQGGLLAKLLAVESGDVFWRNIASVPIEEVTLEPESRELLRRSLFFEPLPFVKRVVFLATPHRGSHLADLRIASWLSRFVKLPASVSKTAFDIAALGSDEFYLSALNRLPTSLDNMASNNPFLRALMGLPLAPGIGSNSIIAVRGTGPYREGTDGVVRYASAHREDVDSELVVQPSGHSVQRRQEGIQELRRILVEHAALE
jgi:pimeloyl-ACP methyl ester carboxylesterase